MLTRVAIGLIALAAMPAPALAAPADAQPAPPPETGIAPPTRLEGATVARVVSSTFARERLVQPRVGRKVKPHTAWTSQPQTLLVLSSLTYKGREWVKLLLAERPNGSAGWVPRDKVVLSRTRYWVDVLRSARKVVVRREGEVVRRFRAVVGAPGTPTPLGLSAIYERNPQPDPKAFLGPWVLSLTSFSNVLENFGGGPGRVALHGRSGASFEDPLGSARSHGCIRINNRPISWMARHLPPGKPVLITR